MDVIRFFMSANLESCRASGAARSNDVETLCLVRNGALQGGAGRIDLEVIGAVTGAETPAARGHVRRRLVIDDGRRRGLDAGSRIRERIGPAFACQRGAEAAGRHARLDGGL